MGRWNWAIGVIFCAAAAAQQAPRVIERQEPQYSGEARAARLQGTVVLGLVVGEDGQPREIRVTRPLGLGLDENAVAAVSRWRFEPGTRDGLPAAVATVVQVEFHLAPDAQAWHLSRAGFQPQDGVTPPVLIHAPYPARGHERYGSVSVSFDVDEQGRPVRIRVENASAPDFEDEVIALIREWRFQAATRNGIPIAMRGYLDFTHGLDLPAAPRPAARKK